MKKTIVLGIALLLAACAQNTKSADDNKTAAPTQEKSVEIRLNNGAKWKVSPEMKPYVAKGSELVDAYLSSHSQDYKTLAKQLEEQNEKLIGSCSMTGESHDELHKWLHPHLELVEALDDAENADVAQKTVEKLRESYGLYAEYFE